MKGRGALRFQSALQTPGPACPEQLPAFLSFPLCLLISIRENRRVFLKEPLGARRAAAKQILRKDLFHILHGPGRDF